MQAFGQVGEDSRPLVLGRLAHEALVGAPGDGLVYHFRNEGDEWTAVQRLAEPVQSTFRTAAFGETRTVGCPQPMVQLDDRPQGVAQGRAGQVLVRPLAAVGPPPNGDVPAPR